MSLLIVALVERLFDRLYGKSITLYLNIRRGWTYDCDMLASDEDGQILDVGEYPTRMRMTTK